MMELRVVRRERRGASGRVRRAVRKAVARVVARVVVRVVDVGGGMVAIARGVGARLCRKGAARFARRLV